MDTEVSFRAEQCLTQTEFCDWVEAHANELHGKVELIHGRIVMTPPATLEHGGIAAEICSLIRNHVKQRRLGRVYVGSAGFDLPSGDTLEPDVSFVSNQRLAAAPTPPQGFGRAVPDLVVEIASPSTAKRDSTEKKAIYAANDVREYWIVEPELRAITVFHLMKDGAFDTGVIYTSGAATSEVLPALEIDLDGLFD